MERIISEIERRANCSRVLTVHILTWQLSSVLFNIIYSQYLPKKMVIYLRASFYVKQLIGL